VTGDRIVLTIPRNEGYENVAQLVIAGVAARLDFSYEFVDDLGTALETLLDWRPEAGELTVELEVSEGSVRALLGPFRGDGLRGELEHPGEGVGLRRVLETVVDRFAAVDGQGGAWIELEKHVPSVEPAT
jgi:hypothetical protein